MKKLSIILFCLILLLSACETSTPEVTEAVESDQTSDDGINPQGGFYEGTTDQDEKMSIWVEDINGTVTVTGFLYNITLQGDGWSSEVTQYQKIDCNLAVEDGKFIGYLDMNNPSDTVEVSGLFSEDTIIVGQLRHTSQHAQPEYGSATADIKFDAERTGTLEEATLPEPDSLPPVEEEAIPTEEATLPEPEPIPTEEEEVIPTEEAETQEPAESPEIEAVILADNEVWFNSHPSSAEVYAVPITVEIFDVELEDIIQPANLVGTCPVIASVDPGNYYIVFKFSAALYEADGLVLPSGSDPTFSESLPFDGNPIKQTQYGPNDAVETVNKLYRLNKKAGSSESVISLAVPLPESERLASPPLIYPTTTAVSALPIKYGFDESIMRESIEDDLRKQNLTSVVDSDMIEDMITVLLRVGKVKLQTEEIDIFIHMIGFSGNGWTVTVYS
mgnify:CR=1 FL=1